MQHWKWACEPVEVLACCYIIIHGNWRYFRELPPELELLGWKEKIGKFKETFELRDGDALLGYIVVFDENDNISAVLAIVLYHSDNPAYSRATVDFIDIDGWLRFIEQHPDP
jgi:hypothetical protein